MGLIWERLEKGLKAMGMNGMPREYLQASAKRAALLSIGSWFVLVLFLDDLAAGFLYAVIILALSTAFFLYMPAMERKKTAALIEKDLPFALMAMSVELNMRISFEKAIQNIANGNYGLLSGEFKKIISEVRETGSPVEEALFNFAERSGSQAVKRCVSQLVNIYAQGSRKNAGEPIRRLAVEQLAGQKAESKEFSGKLVVFSLMFIAISAIVPALFQSFIVVGSAFMVLDFSALQVLLITAVVFPLLDLGLLLYIRGKTPMFLRG